MYSKNTLAHSRVTPLQVKTVYKCSRTLTLQLQLTTNQITRLPFTLKNQNHPQLASLLETHWITKKLKLLE